MKKFLLQLFDDLAFIVNKKTKEQMIVLHCQNRMFFHPNIEKFIEKY